MSLRIFSSFSEKLLKRNLDSENFHFVVNYYNIRIKLAAILIAALLAFSCGGGGGGGGGMVAFAPSEGGAATPHNGGDAGGWGKGTQTGPGLDPQGSNSFEEESGLLITQMAALENITTVRIELTINGVPQPAIIADATTTKDVLPRIGPNDTVSGTAYINLSNGPTRVALLEETHVELGKALPFKVPYYYRCVNSSGTEIVPSTEYFSRDGINLSDHTTENMAGWLCTNDGTMHNGNYVSGVRGDITLTPVYNAPDCTITVTPPGTAIETASDSGIYKITNISDSFGFVVGLSDGTSFPAGTSTTWQINGTAFSGTSPETCGAAPDDVGITEASIGSNATNASTMTINCLINIPGEPQAAVTKTIKVFKKIDMPTTFSIDVTAPATASEDTAATGKYAVTAPADTFTFAASLSGGATFPTGTVFNWTINAGGTTITKTGQSVTVAPSSGAALSTIYASPTSWTISCAISHPDMANATAPSDTKTISLYKENPLKMTVGTPSTGTSYSGDIYKITDMSNTFSFEPTEEDGSPLPAAETSFQWYVGGNLVSGEMSYTFYAPPTTLGLDEATMGTNQTNATPVEVKCVVTRPSGNSVPVVKTIKVFKPVTLPTSFDVTVTAPSTAGTSEPYAVYSNTDSFTFAAAPSGGGSFPTGTKFSWTITGGSSTATRSNLSTASVSIPASEFGTIGTTSASPTTLTATCTIDHADKLNAAQNDDTTAQVYKFTIPAFTITFTPADGSYNTDKSNTTSAVPVYAMTDTTSSFTIKAVPTAGTFPDGTKFSWTVNGYTMNGGTQHGDTLSDLTFSSIGLSNLSTSSASPTSFGITCTAHDDHNPVLVTKNADAKTVKVWKVPTLPSFTISTTAPDSVAGTGSPYGLFSMSDEFTFNAVPSGGAVFPQGTVFKWEANGTVIYEQTATTALTTATCKASATAMGLTASTIGTTSSTANDITIICTVSHPDSGVPVQVSPGINERADISVYKVTIPDDCAVSVQTAPSGSTATGNTYKLSSPTGSFKFKVDSLSGAGSDIIENSICNWSITKQDGSAFVPTATTSEVTVSLADLGFSTANLPTTAAAAQAVTASCTITNPSIPGESQSATSITVNIYLVLELPEFAVQLTSGPSMKTFSGFVPGVTDYQAYDLNANQSFSFEAVPTSGSFPDGTTFEWKVVSPQGINPSTVQTNATTTKTYMTYDFPSGMALPNQSTTYQVHCIATFNGTSKDRSKSLPFGKD